MRVVQISMVAVLVTGTALLAQNKANPVLDHVLRQTQVEGKSLIETARLLGAASGVPVKIEPELRACATSDRRGCDWRIYANWGGQTLDSALQTLCGSAGLAYRVSGGTVVITRRPANSK